MIIIIITRILIIARYADNEIYANFNKLPATKLCDEIKSKYITVLDFI